MCRLRNSSFPWILVAVNDNNTVSLDQRPDLVGSSLSWWIPLRLTYAGAPPSFRRTVWLDPSSAGEGMYVVYLCPSLSRHVDILIARLSHGVGPRRPRHSFLCCPGPQPRPRHLLQDLLRRRGPQATGPGFRRGPIREGPQTEKRDPTQRRPRSSLFQVVSSTVRRKIVLDTQDAPNRQALDQGKFSNVFSIVP